MGRIGPLLIAAFLTLAAPPASAQEAASELATDPAGDLMAQASGQSTAMVLPHYGPLDLVALTGAESESSVDLTLKVATLDEARVPTHDDTYWTIDFAHHDQGYHIQVYRYVGDQDYIFAILSKEDPSGEGRNFVRFMPVAVDPTAATLTMSLPRDDLLDRQGASPFPGRELTGFVVQSHLMASQEPFFNINGESHTSPYDVADRMPDTGAGKTMPFTKGLAQTGHVALWSLGPMRASNGEEATFVYNVTAQNTGPDEELFEVKVTGTPSTWDVNVPDKYVRIPGGAIAHFPVLVSTPFAHNHGTVQKFIVELASTVDPGSVGRVQLGIRYHEVPQPAGHHPDLFFHTARYGQDNPLFPAIDAITTYAGGFTYMNTLEQDPQDQKVPVHGYYWGYYCQDSCPPEPRSQWRWYLYLAPSLEMGLDFDLTKDGTIVLPLSSKVPLAQAVVAGRLMHERFDEVTATWHSTTIAELTPTAPMDMAPDTPETFTFTFKANKSADLIPHAKRAYLTLQVELTSVRPSFGTGADAPDLVPGGRMTLPLHEYRDPIGASFSSVGDVRLDVDGASDRVLNPAKTAVYTLQVASDLDHDAGFEVTVSGIRAPWVRVLDPSVTVPAGGRAAVRVAVEVPADAVKGDLVDVIVSAQARDDEGLRALTRLTGLVDPAQDVPDEASLVQASAGNATPAAGIALVGLLALAAIAARRRA